LAVVMIESLAANPERAGSRFTIGQSALLLTGGTLAIFNVTGMIAGEPCTPFAVIVI
jgi:hypothetical protein